MTMHSVPTFDSEIGMVNAYVYKLNLENTVYTSNNPSLISTNAIFNVHFSKSPYQYVGLRPNVFSSYFSTGGTSYGP